MHFSVISATEMDSSLVSKFTFQCGLRVSTFIKSYIDYMKCLTNFTRKLNISINQSFSSWNRNLCFKIYEKSLNLSVAK